MYGDGIAGTKGLTVHDLRFCSIPLDPGISRSRYLGITFSSDVFFDMETIRRCKFVLAFSNPQRHLLNLIPARFVCFLLQNR